jgi:GNAT superfamily N-acetyltransferase
MKIVVRPRTPADDPALARLLAEMQGYYGVHCPPPATILNDLAHLPLGIEILVAEAEAVIGLAVFSAIYPGPGLAAGFFLKEIFVSEAFRESGAGTLLMRNIARIAVDRGFMRVDWTAARTRPRLLAFYDALGAIRQEDKVFFRLTGDALTGARGQVLGGFGRDPAVVHLEHAVCSVHPDGLVRDRQDRAVAAQPAHRIADFARGGVVERAGRLVQDQHLGIMDQCARDREPLLLSA